ncbi:hypothetical protein IV102_15045 [bacterium]|nr:hypothetical protein [bacterium]
MLQEDDETLPQQQEDDGSPEDRDQLLEQLKCLGTEAGPAAALLQVGYAWLQGTGDKAAVFSQAESLEARLEAELNDPMLVSQLDRLQDGLGDDIPNEVLYALLGLGYQLKA